MPNRGFPGEPWNHKERRNSSDHDTLIELVQIVKNLAEDIRNQVDVLRIQREIYEKHVIKDEEQFGGLYKALWMINGGAIVIVFLINLFKH